MRTPTVAVMGSTGSIGTQTLEVIDAADGRWQVAVLAAHADVDGLAAQAERWHPEAVVLADERRADELAGRLDRGIELLVGAKELGDAAASCDIVVNGVVGFAGLDVTLATLRDGKRLALANKESLIAAGPLVAPLRATPGAELIPVDSEHCAVHQCIGNGRGLARIVLTASGGPFRGATAERLADVTVDEALAHPTWAMGPKITVDSSTLFNKGLEVIEAHELFGLDYDSIDVVVHPQSIVHSMATFSDGATIAQLSLPDMRLPIAYALAYPERAEVPFGEIDWTSGVNLTFDPPDRELFPCLDLCVDAGRAGATAPAWLSAANEVVVSAFLAGRLPWSAIAPVNRRAFEAWDGEPADSVDAVLAADCGGRLAASNALAVWEGS